MATYILLADLKARIEKTLTDDDTVLTALIEAASRAVDGFCNRPDGFVALTNATARVYVGRGLPYLYIDETPAVTAVAVKTAVENVAYVAWVTPTALVQGDWVGFRGEWEDPDFNGTPYQGIMVTPAGDYGSFLDGIGEGSSIPTVQVTGKWGYATTVPPVVKEATGIIAARWYKRGQSAWADTLAIAEFGIAEFRKLVDPDVQFMLSLNRLVRPVTY
jgi:hypothetical protein